MEGGEKKTLSSSNNKKILLNPLPVRIFHWTLVISLVFAISSGLQISFVKPLTTIRTVRFIHISSGLIALAIIIYRVGYALISGDYINFIITKKDIKTAPRFIKYYVFMEENLPPLDTKYNIGQKITFLSWLGVILFLSFGGILILNSFFITKGNMFFPISRIILPKRLRMAKYFLTIYLVITIMLHIYLALTSDIAKTQAMFTGWVQKK